MTYFRCKFKKYWIEAISKKDKKEGGWIILVDALLQSGKFLALLERLYPEVNNSDGKTYTINHIVSAFPSELFTYKHQYQAGQSFGLFQQKIEHSLLVFEEKSIFTHKGEQYGGLSEAVGRAINSVEAEFSKQFKDCKFIFFFNTIIQLKIMIHKSCSTTVSFR